MNALERATRDKEIMREIRAGSQPRKIATKHELTLERVRQIIRREKHERVRKKRHMEGKRFLIRKK